MRRLGYEVGWSLVAVAVLVACAGGGKDKDAVLGDVPAWSEFGGEYSEAAYGVVLGRPAATSIAASVQVEPGTEVVWEYGTSPGAWTVKTPVATAADAYPLVTELSGLQPDTTYHYRVSCRAPGATDFVPDTERTFRTQPAPGRTFAFGVQGDSHPERAGKMYSAELYARNMQNVAERRPDFYVGLGDDFSIERLLEKNTLTRANVDAVYQNQRNFFGILGNATALFLVNGNHEQVAGYLLTGNYPTTWAQAPILAGQARNAFFPLPAPDGFYTGDETPVDGVGLLRDYYAFEWGDALFVTLDPYWHSPVPIDTGVPGVDKEKDGWKQTLGDAQYQWFRRTLQASKAKWKFVFEHHVLGNGRGGAAIAHLYEWGGYDEKGKTWQFADQRPGWEKPMHQLMNDAGVTMFISGHDHLFAREKVDGIVYQSVPNPADNTYTAFNADAFDPDAIAFPGAAYDPAYGEVQANSGYLHVTVTPASVRVDYVRAVLPGDEAKAGCANGEVTFSYVIGG